MNVFSVQFLTFLESCQKGSACAGVGVASLVIVDFRNGELGKVHLKGVVAGHIFEDIAGIAP